MEKSRWSDPGWLDGAHAWIGRQVAAQGARVTGPLEQPHVAPWSTVLRVPTDQGTWWFKANEDALRHEAALVQLLASRRPDAVPPLVAVDTTTGWMLMADAGETLRVVAPREQSLARWFEALELYAGVQLDLEDDVETLLALGVPDRRLAGLPGLYDDLMDRIDADRRFRAAAPRVTELCEKLTSYGIRETLNHDDLHDAQVFVQQDRLLLMDWGDACVSHPFFTLSVTLEGVLAWGLEDEESSVDVAPYRDAYLAPYAERYGREVSELAESVPAALRLGWACRAVNGHVPGDDRQTEVRLRMFLDGKPG